MSIREAATAIRAGLDLLASGRAVLLATAVAFAEARTGVEQATRGTNRPEAAQAISALTTALDGIGEVLTQLDAAADTTTDYLNHIAGGHTTETTPRSTPNRVEQLRAELPRALKGTGTGRKTHGRWFVGDHPAQSIVSGNDDDSILAARYLKQVGLDRGSIQAHVEVKLSALIRQRWEHTGRTANVTIVINHEVCHGLMSCFVFLPLLLPPGCSMTVYTPTTRHTFMGDQQS